MVWGPAWLSRLPEAVPSSRLLRLLRLRLLSMEVMLEEEVVRERASRVIPADGTERRERPLIFHSRCRRSLRCGNTAKKCKTCKQRGKPKKAPLKAECTSKRCFKIKEDAKEKKKSTRVIKRNQRENRSSTSCSKAGDWGQSPCWRSRLHSDRERQRLQKDGWLPLKGLQAFCKR